MASDEKYFLPDTLVVEPLVQRWPAWSHVVAPAAAAFHVANYQMPVLESFVASPEAHAAAVRDPDMIGGPFVDVPPARAAEVEALRAEMGRARAAEFEFVRASSEFSLWLIGNAHGEPLSRAYAAIPEPLRGYVELGYDYHDRPIMRFLEGALYRSRHHRRDLQSIRLFPLESDRERAFLLSTPRLRSANEIEIAIPFDDARVDRLFESWRTPRSLGEFREDLGLPIASEKALGALLTNVAPRPRPPWSGPGVRLQFVGHACVLIEAPGVTILTDPVVPSVPAIGAGRRISYADLPERIDYVLITHDHHDHLSLESLIRLRRRIGTLIVPRSLGVLTGDLSVRKLAESVGFENVVELDEFASVRIPGGEIIGAPFYGEHADLLHGNKATYVVRLGDENILVAADADCIESRLYDSVRRAVGPIRTVLLGTESVGAPMSWTSGAMFPSKPPAKYDKTRRYHGCGAEAALRLTESVGATRVFNYAMGFEPWMSYLVGLVMDDSAPQMAEARELMARMPGYGIEFVQPIAGTELTLDPVRGAALRQVPGRRVPDYWEAALALVARAPVQSPTASPPSATPAHGEITVALEGPAPNDPAQLVAIAAMAWSSRYPSKELLVGLCTGKAQRAVLPVALDLQNAAALPSLAQRAELAIALARRSEPELDTVRAGRLRCRLAVAIDAECPRSAIEALIGSSAVDLVIAFEAGVGPSVRLHFDGVRCSRETASSIGRVIAALSRSAHAASIGEDASGSTSDSGSEADFAF